MTLINCSICGLIRSYEGDFGDEKKSFVRRLVCDSDNVNDIKLKKEEF